MSSSRNRKDVATLFDVFCEVGAGADGGGAVILQKYPEDFFHEQTLKSVTQFSFPCGLDDDEVEAVQLFSFVLTDEKSQYTYAFCRHTPRNNTCICILSGLSWANIFYKLLNHISTVMNNRPAEELESLLIRAYHTPIPGPDEVFIIESGLAVNKLELVIPDDSRLPTLREDKYMLEFYNAVPEKQMIALYASLLKERRIVFTGRKLSQLSSCVFAAATLLFPMHWQNLFIPVLPSDIIDMLMAPMPYLVGVPKKTLQAAVHLDLGEVVVVDLDQRTLQSAHNDVAALPSEAVTSLRHQLRSSADMFLSDGLARSFLRTNVLLFGGYRDGLCYNSSYSWNGEKFVKSQLPCLQPFLQSLIGQDGVQYFERFIEERVAALNSGVPIDDEFEREVRLVEHKPLKTSQLVHVCCGVECVHHHPFGVQVLTRFFQTNPEVFQHAVSSVRENANDMFGALKDKVHSIALKERLGRLTPKEIRRNSSKKPSSVWNGSPMSFDTQQWTTEEASPAATVTEAVVEQDLIDLDDNCASTSCANATRSVPPSTSATPSLAPSLSPGVPMHHRSLQSFDFAQFSFNTDPSSTTTNSSHLNIDNPPLSRGHWQRFD